MWIKASDPSTTGEFFVNSDLLERVYPSRNGGCHFTLTSRPSQLKTNMTAEELMKAYKK